MIVGWAARRRLLVGLLAAQLLIAGHALAQASLVTAAAAKAAAQDAAPPMDAPLASLAHYREAFEAAYQPAHHELEALRVAEAALGAAESALLPRLDLGQRLAWDAFAELSLELETGIEIPLLSSTAGAERSLAELDLEARRLGARLAAAEAHANLLVELANLAVVAWAEELVDETVISLAAVELPWSGVGPVPAGVGTDPTARLPGAVTPDLVAPADRDAYDAYLRLFEFQAWLGEQSTIMTRRLARALEVPAARLLPPALGEIEEFMADRLASDMQSPNALPSTRASPGSLAQRAAVDVAACMSSSLRVEAARLRHARHVADDSLAALPEYSLALTARLAYAFDPWAVGGAAGGSAAGPGGAGGGAEDGDFRGAIALEGRYLVPDSWPLGGTASLEVGPEGVSQRLALAWPPLPTPRPVPADRNGDLADELAAIADELGALRSAALQASAERQRLQRQLTWALLDAPADLIPDEVAAALEALTAAGAAAAGLEGQPPTVLGSASHLLPRLEVTELRVQHAFARLGEVSAQVQFLAACGRL